MGYPINLVTGSRGTNHVTSADDGSLFASIVGPGQYVLSGFGHEVVNNNTIRIKSGDVLINGRHAKINHGDSVNVNIENGSAGMNRCDLIVVTYKKESGIESAEIEVLKGQASASVPQVPSYTTGNILNDDTLVQMPLYQVNLEGISISSVSTLYQSANTLQVLFDMIIPPVGWIEYNETGINPGQRYPGTTWELVGRGAVDACVDPADSTLKNAGTIVGDNKGRLVAENIPSHKHGVGSHTHFIGEHTHHIGGTLRAENGQHNHLGFVVKDLAAGTSKNRLTQYGAGSAARSSDVITYPYSPAQSGVPNVGEHTHRIDVDLESENTTTPTESKTGTISGAYYTEEYGSAAEFSTMQKTYLVYRWKRIS